MANKYGIPQSELKKIQARDKTCVYCHKIMTNSKAGGRRVNWATIEHLREEGPFYWNQGLKEEDLAICCLSCNASRGKRGLLDWFKSPYCAKRGINQQTVADPVKNLLRSENTIPDNTII